ncbi:MAG: NB-ARC domain-containing protein, partial [Chloroflexota bacterium]
YMLFTVPFPRKVDKFFGREAELTQLEETLKSNSQVGINNAGLSGMGGIGKTQLAVEFCYRAREKELFPDGIFWINAAGDLRRAFSDLALDMAQAQLMPDDAQGIKDFLKINFSLAELYELVADLKIDKDELNPTKTPFILDLVSLCQRQGRLPDLGKRTSELRPDVRGRSQDKQIDQIFDYLKQNPSSLVVFDNAEQPENLSRPLAQEMVPTKLPCAVLITTRSQSLHRFRPISLNTLGEEDALKLLLNHHSRQPVFNDENHPEREVAKEICQMVGYFPLALEVAGAQLGKRAGASLAAYRDTLQKRGAFATIDNKKLAVETTYQMGLEAILQEQLDSLESEEARTLLKVAAQFEEAEELPITRLGAMAGLNIEAEDFFDDVTIVEALRQLTESSLMEKLAEKDATIWETDIRLHPLVREFAQTQAENRQQFRAVCAKNLIDQFEEFELLEQHAAERGVYAIQNDLLACLDLLANEQTGRAADQRMQTLLRILKRELHNLADWDAKENPLQSAQQLFYRTRDLGLKNLLPKAKEHFSNKLTNDQTKKLSYYLSPSWRATHESAALIQTFAGHTGGINSVAITPDGSRAVSASSDSTLKVWNLKTGEEERMLSGHSRIVRSVAITPDGSRAVSASSDSTLKVWNLKTGEEERTLSGHSRVVRSVAITPDGKRAVSASSDRTLKVWNLGQNEFGLEERTLSGHTNWVMSVAITPDGKRAVSASDDRTLKVWNLITGKLILSLGLDGQLQTLALTPDGRKIVVGDAAGSVYCFDLVEIGAE